MRASWLWLAFALGLLLRLWSLSAHSLLLDEAFVAVGARDMLRNSTPMWDAISNAPFVWAVGHTLGLSGLDSPFWLRLPAALFGTLSIIPLYLLARRMFGNTIGAIAAVLYALHPFAVAFSRVLFADPFQVFFVICGWLAFDISLAHQSKPNIRGYIVTVIIWAVAFLMKYNAIVPGIAWLLAGILAERYALRSAFFLGLAMVAGNVITLLLWPYDAPIWLAAFLEKSTGYDLGNSALYFWSKSHLVLFAITEISIIGAVIVAFSQRTQRSHALRHIVSFLLIFIVTVIVLGRTFERYLLVSVPIACLMLAAVLVHLFERAREHNASGRIAFRVALVLFVLLIAVGYYRTSAHYISYLKNDVDLSRLTAKVTQMERNGRRGFWLLSEPVGAYYLGFSQHYSRSAGVNANDALAPQNYFEFCGAPYSDERAPYNVLVARRVARERGLWSILSSPTEFIHVVRRSHAARSTPLPSANYFSSDLVRAGDALIMRSGATDILGEPILEQLDSTALPPTFTRLPLQQFSSDGCGAEFGDTTIERIRAKAWILLRK